MTRSNITAKGFTLIEVAVGLLIFTIGILGFTGMTLMMSKGQQFSKARDEMITLSQSQIEDLSGIGWDELGADTTLPAYNGLANAAIVNEGPINRNGDEAPSGDPPYKYMRYLVLCDAALSTVTPNGDMNHCGVINDTNRPPELSCDDLGLTVRDKLIRIIISYEDRNGRCRFTEQSSLSFDWDG